MPVTCTSCLKIISVKVSCYILFLATELFSSVLYAQNKRESEFEKVFRDNFIRFLHISESFYNDSICFQYNDVIIADVDNNSRISSVRSSEKGQEWMKTEIKQLLVKKHLKIHLLDSIAKTEKIRASTIIFPIELKTGRICKDTVKFLNNDFEKYAALKKRNKPLADTIIANIIYEWYVTPRFGNEGNPLSPALPILNPKPYNPKLLFVDKRR